MCAVDRRGGRCFEVLNANALPHVLEVPNLLIAIIVWGNTSSSSFILTLIDDKPSSCAMATLVLSSVVNVFPSRTIMTGLEGSKIKPFS